MSSRIRSLSSSVSSTSTRKVVVRALTATSSRNSVMIWAATAAEGRIRDVRVPAQVAATAMAVALHARRLRRLGHRVRERLHDRAGDPVREHRPLGRRPLRRRPLARGALGREPRGDESERRRPERGRPDERADRRHRPLGRRPHEREPHGRDDQRREPRRRDAVRDDADRRHDRRHELSGFDGHDGHRHRDDGDDRGRRGGGHVVRALRPRLRLGDDRPCHGHVGDRERDRGRDRRRHRVPDERWPERIDDGRRRLRRQPARDHDHAAERLRARASRRRRK